MWAVINATAYAAERSWVQDKNANKIWLVVVKATFDIRPDGSCALADKQVPVLRMGRHHAEPANSSLLYEADLSGLKPCTDVLVHANAWAPGGKRASSVDVQLTAGPIRKRLRVFGDRVWERSIVGTLVASAPQPFASMPVTYERAFGGWDRRAGNPAEHRLESRNPVGTGFVASADGCAGMRLPNVEAPDRLIGSWKDRPAPAGLNAIECHWSPRRELAGTYDDAWRKARFPLWAEDFNPRYNNCAPSDQQSEVFLRGGERVELVNLCASGQLAFTLPRIYPFFETRFGSERVEHRGELCTVIVEPEAPRVIMAWQTSMVCNHRVDDLDATVVTEKRVI